METLELIGLEKTFANKTVAVRQVSLTVRPGERVAIIGRSGAGKSTLLRLINRLVEPSGGIIRFGSLDIRSLRGKALRRWRADCAMIFQQFGLVRRSSVLTNVLHGKLIARNSIVSALGFSSRADRSQAVALLARLGMADFAFQRVDTLSGGQQQRVAIARALMQQPRLMLADEPVASLDPESARAVMESLSDIARNDGIAVLCNLHDIPTARQYFARIIGMRAGEIVFDGPVADLTDAVLARIYGSSANAGSSSPRPVAAE